MEKLQYVCPKCGCTQYESDQFQATGGNFDKPAAAKIVGVKLA